MTAPVTTAVRALRLKAAEIIEQRGWCQGYYCTRDGAVCVLGALNVAAGLDAEDVSGCDLIDDAINEVFGYESAANWNDAISRTKAEVLARLREGL
jgi:hypothetical protein